MTSRDEEYNYKTREEFEAWVERVQNNEDLSPSRRADLIAGAPEPDETPEEGLERNEDD